MTRKKKENLWKWKMRKEKDRTPKPRVKGSLRKRGSVSIKV